MAFSAAVTARANAQLIPKAVDAISSGSPMSLRFLGNAKKFTSVEVNRQIILTAKSNGKSFDGLDTFNTNSSMGDVQSTFDVRAYTEPVVIKGLEKDALLAAMKNDDAAFDLLKFEMQRSQEAMVSGIGTIFFGDGTGNGGKDFLGLKAAIDDATVVTTYGGISRSTYTAWKANRYPVSGNLADLGDLATAESAARHGNQMPTMHITDETQWNAFEGLLQPTIVQNYATNGYPAMTRTGTVSSVNSLGAQAGFNALFYRGRPVVADELCTASYWYMINEKTIAWFGLASTVEGYEPMGFGTTEIEGVYDGLDTKNLGLSFSGMKVPDAQYAEVGHIILAGNLICHNPNRNSVIVFNS